MIKLRQLFDFIFTPKIPINIIFKPINPSLIKLRVSLATKKILKLKHPKLKLKKLNKRPFRPSDLRRQCLAKKKRKTITIAGKNKGSKRLNALFQPLGSILLNSQVKNLTNQIKI